MHAKTFFVAIGIVILASPIKTQGATTQELLQQIANLQSQIATLQSQLTQLKAAQPFSSFQQTLRMTDQNAEVKKLQEILKQEGLFCRNCQATGYFGWWTKAGLMNFQQRYGLPITGTVNDQTKTKLNQYAGVNAPQQTQQPQPQQQTQSPPTPAPPPSSGQDSIAPSFSIVINDGASSTNNQDVIIRVECEDPSGGEAMRFSNFSTFTNEPWGGAEAGKLWRLSSGDGLKTVYAQCQDEKGNIANASDSITLDALSPVTSSPGPTGTLAAGTTQATLSLTTNEQATCRYAQTPNTDYDMMRDADTFSGTNTSHSIIVSTLSPGSYSFYVRCKDVMGNKNSFDTAISFNIASITTARTSFFVKPYLVYPADKPMYPQYEIAVNSYLTELQNWYKDKVGATFTLKPLVVVRSSFNYLTMRCGPTPTEACVNDLSKLEGNWGMYMNMAIHNGQEQWEAETATLVFGAGGGGFAGANVYSNYTAYAITGDWVLEPISGIPNTWGIPCSYSDGWQCVEGVPKGSPAHELGHAFGLPHPGEQYASQTIMQWHGNFPSPAFLQQEIDALKQSPFFK
ncbi:MAG: peptidoglycan-binding protein [Candidatus Wildermuthbacteria bacterium]|nr:peptidoglycan-binding protein [Candidatus Wildermuthbacteria bacterium]